LRLIEEEAMKDKTSGIIAQIPVQIASFLLNEKRQSIVEIDKRYGIKLMIVPNPALDTPNFEIQRIRNGETSELEKASYDIAATPELDVNLASPEKSAPPEQPAVKGIIPTSPAPAAQQQNKGNGGFIKQLWGNLFGNNHEEEKQEPRTQPRRRPSGARPSGNGSRPRRTRSRDGQPQRRKRPQTGPGTRKKTQSSSNSTSSSSTSSSGNKNAQQNKPAKGVDEATAGNDAAAAKPRTQRGGRGRRGRRGGRKQTPRDTAAQTAQSTDKNTASRQVPQQEPASPTATNDSANTLQQVTTNPSPASDTTTAARQVTTQPDKADNVATPSQQATNDPVNEVKPQVAPKPVPEKEAPGVMQQVTTKPASSSPAQSQPDVANNSTSTPGQQSETQVNQNKTPDISRAESTPSAPRTETRVMQQVHTKSQATGDVRETSENKTDNSASQSTSVSESSHSGSPVASETAVSASHTPAVVESAASPPSKVDIPEAPTLSSDSNPFLERTLKSQDSIFQSDRNLHPGITTPPFEKAVASKPVEDDVVKNDSFNTGNKEQHKDE